MQNENMRMKLTMTGITIEGNPHDLVTFVTEYEQVFEDREKDIQRATKREQRALDEGLVTAILAPPRRIGYPHNAQRLSRDYISTFGLKNISKENVKIYLKALNIPARKKLVRRIILSLKAIRDNRVSNMRKSRRKKSTIERWQETKDGEIVEELTGKPLRKKYRKANYPMLASEWVNFTPANSISMTAFLKKHLQVKWVAGAQLKLFRKAIKQLSPNPKPEIQLEVEGLR